MKGTPIEPPTLCPCVDQNVLSRPRPPIKDVPSFSSSYAVVVGAATTHALETGDNVVTASTVGAAVVGGAAMHIAPQSIRDKIAVGKKTCNRCFDK